VLTGVTGLILTATPDPNSTFGGWIVEGGATSFPSGNQLTVDLPGTIAVPVVDPAGDTLVTAIFNLIGFPGPFPQGVAQVQVNKAGTGTGTVTSSNISGINCGTDCFEVYNWATGLTLTATPNPGSTFGGWNVAGGATNVVQNGSQISLNLNWPFWDSSTWPWNWNLANYSTLVTATFNTATATVAAATASTFTHIHQHGGIVTGHVHHGVYHAKKHVHKHTHAL
jgi:hypothetical protein